VHLVNRLLGSILLFVLVLIPAAAQTAQRTNCGGARYVDSNGHVWEADYGFSGGTAGGTEGYVPQPTIKGTNDPTLYKSNRYNQNANSHIVYNFKEPNGTYHVNLYFAETYEPLQFTGGRVFNVKMQGATVFSNVDVFGEAGANAALIKGADVTVTNGEVTIEFDNVVQAAIINAIEVLPGTSGPQVSLSFKYPDGTAVTGKLAYSVSSSALSFSGTEPLVNGQFNCALLANPSALGISAQFTIKVTLSDNAGNLLWNFTIAMNPSQINLATVQDSTMTVVVQKVASSGGS
jgi:hypothetical protein